MIKRISGNNVVIRIRNNSNYFTCTVEMKSTIIVLFSKNIKGGTNATLDGLSPNTTYSIDCIGGKDQCLESNTTVTTNATGN